MSRDRFALTPNSGGDAWVHFAIEQADRAVGELAE